MKHWESFEFMVECANKSFSPRAKRFVNELYAEIQRLRDENKRLGELAFNLEEETVELKEKR